MPSSTRPTGKGSPTSRTSFQSLILKLQNYWASKGCVILQPYDMEVGAGTFHWATTLRRGRSPGRCLCAAVAATSDGRYGDNQTGFSIIISFKVILKPSPENGANSFFSILVSASLELTRVYMIFGLLKTVGKPNIRAWGLGWEIWCDGMEVGRWRIFNRSAALNATQRLLLNLPTILERLAMYVQGVERL